MSEDNKINGRVIANARVTGLLNTVIKRVDGVAVNTTAFSTGLLDTYGSAAGAYSVRRLSSSYTGACMRVREDGTNTETDIGFNSAGNLDVLAIRDHCGSNNGFVRWWYDQSGNANDAGQATEASQPQIYNGTAVLTENGKPVIIAVASDVSFTATYSGASSTTTTAVAFVQGAGRKALTGNSPTNAALLIADSGSSSSAFSNVGTPTVYVDGTLSSIATRDDAYLAFNSNQSLIFAIANYSSFTELDFGLNTAVTGYCYQELIVWNTDQTSPTNNRTGIETNLNDYFQIF